MGFTIRKDSMDKTTIINPINFQTPKFFALLKMVSFLISNGRQYFIGKSIN
jgi:hypothetical protein